MRNPVKIPDMFQFVIKIVLFRIFRVKKSKKILYLILNAIIRAVKVCVSTLASSLNDKYNPLSYRFSYSIPVNARKKTWTELHFSILSLFSIVINSRARRFMCATPSSLVLPGYLPKVKTIPFKTENIRCVNILKSSAFVSLDKI